MWGVIGELPVHPKLRVVGEINGENIQNQRANDSALLGVIWQPMSGNLSFGVYANPTISEFLTRVAIGRTSDELDDDVHNKE